MDPPPPIPPGWAKLSAEKREREGNAGSVQTSLPALQGEEKALDTAAMLSSCVKTQPPNLESGSVSKYCHELKNSPQNETSYGPLVQSFLYKNKPARWLHLHTKGFVFRRKVSFLEE